MQQTKPRVFHLQWRQLTKGKACRVDHSLLSVYLFILSEVSFPRSAFGSVRELFYFGKRLFSWINIGLFTFHPVYRQKFCLFSKEQATDPATRTCIPSTKKTKASKSITMIWFG